MPKISVLIPVYNAESYLEAAVNCILLQSFTDFEVIIINDGSTDSSMDILNELSKKDSRIKIISRANTGIVGALNDGLKECKGEYVARMDADDLCRPNRFDLQIKRMESEPNLVAIGSCAIAIDPDGVSLGDAPVPLMHDEIDTQHLKGITSIYHPAVMMDTNTVRQLGGYREPAWPAEDLDLWLRLGEVGRVANLPDKLFVWRRTLDGIVASSQGRQEKAINWVLAECWNRRKLRTLVPTVVIKPLTTADLLHQFGWQSLKSKQVSTARKYAYRSITSNFGSFQSWKLAFCALRGF